MGNGPSPTGCQQGWEEGRESHIWESISRKPSWGGGAEVVLELRTSGKEGEGKGGTRLYLYIKAESLSHSFNKHRIPRLLSAVTGTELPQTAPTQKDRERKELWIQSG